MPCGLCQMTLGGVHLPASITPGPLFKDAKLAHHKRQSGSLKILAKAGHQSLEFLPVRSRLLFVAVALSLVPEDALECSRLHRHASAGDRIVVGMTLGLRVIAPRLPARDGRTTRSAWNQPDSDVGRCVGDRDPKRSPKADTCHRLIKVDRVDRRGPGVVFGQGQHPRMNRAVLLLHDSTPSHVRLASQ